MGSHCQWPQEKGMQPLWSSLRFSGSLQEKMDNNLTGLSFSLSVTQEQDTLCPLPPAAPPLRRELRTISYRVLPPEARSSAQLEVSCWVPLGSGSADQAQLAVEACSAPHFLRKSTAPGSGTKPLDCPICQRMCVDITGARRLKLNLFCRQKCRWNSASHLVLMSPW